MSEKQSQSKSFKFPNEVSEFTYMRTYSRFIPALGRRETYPETVQRLVNFYENQIQLRLTQGKITSKQAKKAISWNKKIQKAILKMKVMPSMRAMWSAGPAAEFDNSCIYNCAFTSVQNTHDFDEVLYILMCGAGVGFSVELPEIVNLPAVPKIDYENPSLHIVEDSRHGWANSLRVQIRNFISLGVNTTFDYSEVRKEGDVLKTMGGRASGPAPLKKLHDFVRDIFTNAQNRNLSSLEAHDIMCQIAEVVVVGGVRRSSLMGLSSLEDQDLRGAKVFPFPNRRWMANNSVAYDTQPTWEEFKAEWDSMINSGTGERGFFNRGSAKFKTGSRRDASKIKGTNPCGEILLRSKQFCNLSEVVIRAEDTVEDILEKVELATWIGAIQSTFTHFPYLSEEWAKNCEEERLLGVSLTGQMDNFALMTPENLIKFKEKAIATAKEACETLGINMSVAITTTKPSGTVSLVVDSSAGIHSRYAKFAIRRIRISSNDPLYKMYKAQGVPMTPENGQSKEEWDQAMSYLFNSSLNEQERKDKISSISTIFNYSTEEWSEDKVNTWVVSFATKSPDGAITRNDFDALKQLEHYKNIQKYYAEHSVSATIYYRKDEVESVAKWVYENWNDINGLSFLPVEDGEIKYKQAPWEEIDEKTYKKLKKDMPKIDYSQLNNFEEKDLTTGSSEVACSGGTCSLV